MLANKTLEKLQHPSVVLLCTHCGNKIHLELQCGTRPLLSEQSCAPHISRRNLVTAVHGIWHGSGKGRGNPKIYGAFCFICNPGCWGNKQSPSQYRARKISAPVWTRCPDRVRSWTEIVVKVALNTKTATPNTAVRLQQLHFVINHMDIACLLAWTAPEPNGYRLFEESRTSPTMCRSWASWSFDLVV